ncbi:hypothetical protein E4P40_07860 [Blastococcus sp. CT_GayMR20]|uniref:hypothetical protein n=1 Tax=Blastococcus sp. CT_GayMR20 TaxID=2559609 RepID=UPI001074586C|nr:hypothetical protein [Blastococcus sp. CT_GayMR20]TFV90122.1 hypothetical protein E4P40_07860 [Blastococcus sp. CT_GayMR20]
MESAGLGDDVVPAQMLIVPGLGPLLVLAVVGWPDSITMLTVEPGLGAAAKHSHVGSACGTTSAASIPSGRAAAAAADPSGG